jgi:hypothetical protein
VVYTLSFGSVAIIIVGIVFALATVALMRWLLPTRILLGAHSVTGNVLSIVGTLYAVLLGLIVVDAMVHFEQAMEGAQQESNCLADIFLLADRLPEPQRSRVRDLCRTYADEVAEGEWPRMAEGRMSVEARRTALALAKALDDFEPVTEAQKTVFPLILEQTRQLWDERRDRANATQYGIPAVEWFALLVGAAVMVIFVGLFSVEHAGLQYLLTTLAALVIGLNLYLVWLFAYPFAGDLTVSNRPFLLDIGIFEGLFEEGPAHEGESSGRPR